LIADFMEFSDGSTSPEIFRLWSAISLVAGALERRVYVTTARGSLYPSLYILLVAGPGVGKKIVETVRWFWANTKVPNSTEEAFHVGPDSMTKASLVDNIESAVKVHIPPDGSPITYHSLLVASEEFSVLLPEYNAEYIATLNGIWNNKDHHTETRRYGTHQLVDIENPTLNLLGGYQPAMLGSKFPEDAWATGLVRRIIMIHSTKGEYKDLGHVDPKKETVRQKILEKISQISQMYGECTWDGERFAEGCEAPSFAAVRAWDKSGFPDGGEPVPTHSKLQYYNKSRTEHLLKLSIVSAIARTGMMNIQLQDVRRAIYWLTEAEKRMPDIFREMIGKSDAQVLEELQRYLLAEWARSKRQPVQEVMLFKFLVGRVPHEKAQSLLETADKAGIISRIANTRTYIPVPRQEHGVE